MNATNGVTIAPPPALAHREGAETARDLGRQSIAPNTRRAYRTALGGLDAWLDGAALDDRSLAAYIGHLFASGRSRSSALLTLAAARFRARLEGRPRPEGPETERAIAGFKRADTGRGRGQAAPMMADDLAAIVATAHQRRRTGRGLESPEAAARRATTDVAIAGLAFHGGLRRSEIAALLAGDVEPAAAEAGAVRVLVRRSKTNQDGDRPDVRIVKNGPAAALRKLAAAAEAHERIIPLTGQQVARRLEAAGRAAGVERRLTGHSGRVGLAFELTARGASTADVMLAGGWRTARMVAHYSAGAAAERGAVIRFL